MPQAEGQLAAAKSEVAKLEAQLQSRAGTLEQAELRSRGHSARAEQTALERNALTRELATVRAEATAAAEGVALLQRQLSQRDASIAELRALSLD